MSNRSTSIVSAFDAKNRLGRLLDRVQAGEEMVITRRGQAVAKLVPFDPNEDDKAKKALATFSRIRESLRAAGVKVSRQEIQQWRSEGRR